MTSAQAYCVAAKTTDEEVGPVSALHASPREFTAFRVRCDDVLHRLEDRAILFREGTFVLNHGFHGEKPPYLTIHKRLFMVTLWKLQSCHWS
jgi:hypothetical protein